MDREPCLQASLVLKAVKRGQINEDPWYDERLIHVFDPSHTRRYHSDTIQTASRCLITDADEIVRQFFNDVDGLWLLDRGNVFGNQDGLRSLDKDTTVRPLLCVYASAVCAKGEELLTTKSNPPGLGGFGVCESIDDCLLFFSAEVVATAIGPNASLLT